MELRRYRLTCTSPAVSILSRVNEHLPNLRATQVIRSSCSIGIGFLAIIMAWPSRCSLHKVVADAQIVAIWVLKMVRRVWQQLSVHFLTAEESLWKLTPVFCSLNVRPSNGNPSFPERCDSRGDVSVARVPTQNRTAIADIVVIM